jgi:hypothetical protein
MYTIAYETETQKFKVHLLLLSAGFVIPSPF